MKFTFKLIGTAMLGLLAGYLLAYSFAHVASADITRDYQKQYLHPEARNLILNPGAEQGHAGHTANGGTLTVETGTTTASGSRAFKFVTTETTHNVTTDLVTLPNGLEGQGGLSQYKYSTQDSDWVLETLDGAGNVLGSVTLGTTSAGQFSTIKDQGYSFPTITDGATTVQLKLKPGTSNSEIYFDDGYLGENFNVGTVAQAELYGTLELDDPDNLCLFSGTSSSLSNYSADSDCDVTTTGSVSAPGTKIPGFVVSDPGEYQVEVSSEITVSNDSKCAFALSDGTNTDLIGVVGGNFTDSSDDVSVPSMAGNISKDDGGDTTIQIQHKRLEGTGSCSLDARTDDVSVKFRVYKDPSESQKAVSVDESPKHWTGNHGTDCNGWTETADTYTLPAGDSTCTFNAGTLIDKNFPTVSSCTDGSSNNEPCIEWTSDKTGEYEACASVSTSKDSNGQWAVALFDQDGNKIDESSSFEPDQADQVESAKLCGPLTSDNIGETLSAEVRIKTSSGNPETVSITNGEKTSMITWELRHQTSNLPAVFFQNQVLTENESGDNICRGKIGSAATIDRNEGACIDSVTDNATGDHTVNFASDVFSETPDCGVTIQSNSNGLLIVDSISSTSMRVKTTNPANSAADRGFMFACLGDK